MPVADLLERMSAVEFDDWRRYAAIEPFGDERADLRMGILASVIANVNRDPKKQAKPFSPADFIPDFDKPPEPANGFLADAQRAEEQARIDAWQAQALAAPGKVDG